MYNRMIDTINGLCSSRRKHALSSQCSSSTVFVPRISLVPQRLHSSPSRFHGQTEQDLVAVGLVLLLSLEPVGESGGTLAGLGGGVLTLNLNGHALILLQAAGEIGLFGGGGRLGHGKGLNLAFGIGLLDCRHLVGLELLQIELLNEVGWGRSGVSIMSVIIKRSIARGGRRVD